MDGLKREPLNSQSGGQSFLGTIIWDGNCGNFGGYGKPRPRTRKPRFIGSFGVSISIYFQVPTEGIVEIHGDVGELPTKLHCFGKGA
jgi:hypothetical protein